jgi:hypothetical protein
LDTLQRVDGDALTLAQTMPPVCRRSRPGGRRSIRPYRPCLRIPKSGSGSGRFSSREGLSPDLGRSGAQPRLARVSCHRPGGMRDEPRNPQSQYVPRQHLRARRQAKDCNANKGHKRPEVSL